MSENIKLLVKKFSTYKVDAYLIPTTDEFLNEYVPEHNRRLEFITGFSGSAGITVISKKMSYLQTDGRYTLQAKQQLPKDFRIVDTLSEAKDLDKLKIGYDPMTLSNSTLCKLERLFKNKNSKLVAIEKNLVDQIWTNKPSTSDRQALLLKKKYSGQDSKDKIKSICHNIDATCDYLLLTNPDSICWLLNIRAHDIPYTPFLLSYLLLEKKTKKVSLFTDKNKVTHIKGCEIFDIGELKKIFKNLIKKKTTIQSDAKNTPAWFHQNSKDRIVWKTDPCELPKAIKNKTEIEGIINAHIQDGIALTKFLHWLKVNIAKTKIDEISAAEKLEEFRQERELFQYPSFETISGFGKNGAIVHYAVTKKTNKNLDKKNLYLVDSGGQYLNGTTDVTRTISLGRPTAEHKKCFTLVLKGHIALATQKFPIGTSGHQLDAIARQYLWGENLDYLHGTGHGVGHFLSVHEGPQLIGKKGSGTPLEENMIISIEPGFYKANNFGIRIENLYRISASNTKGFLQFENLTLAPIATNLIDKKMLSDEEKKWLKNYHKTVYRNISKFLSAGEKKWLRKFSDF